MASRRRPERYERLLRNGGLQMLRVDKAGLQRVTVPHDLRLGLEVASLNRHDNRLRVDRKVIRRKQYDLGLRDGCLATQKQCAAGSPSGQEESEGRQCGHTKQGKRGMGTNEGWGHRSLPA